MQSNPVVHFEIYVQDMQRARAFYEAVLNIKLEHMPPPGDAKDFADVEMWCFPMDKERGMSTYGTSGMLIKMPGFPSGGSGTLVYFACDDCAVQAARAASHGGSICKEKTSIGAHGFFTLVNDTEGNMIGLHSIA